MENVKENMQKREIRMRNTLAKNMYAKNKKRCCKILKKDVSYKWIKNINVKEARIDAGWI